MLSERAAVLAVLACVATSSGRADDAKVVGDLKKMQGTWSSVGGDVPEHQWVISGETVKVSFSGESYTCAISVDPKAEPQPAIDFDVKEGPAGRAGKLAKGIYKFDGDRLIVCISIPGLDTRPAEFKTVDNEAYLIELKPEK